MTNEQFRTIEQAARAGDITTVKTTIEEADPGIPSTAYHSKAAVAQLIRSGYTDALDQLIDKEVITTDLYDYDRLDTALINELLKPRITSEESWASYLDWLGNYLKKIEDIEEEIASTTLLEHAIRTEVSIPVLKAIVEAGADLMRIDANGYTLLSKVCSMRMTTTQRMEEIVIWLLDTGIDPNAVSVSGKTALHAAISSGKPGVVQKLMEAGADANIADSQGENAFFYAVVGQHSVELLEILLAYQAPDFHAVNKQGENLLNAYLRAMYSDNNPQALKIVGLLLDHGADIRDASLWYGKEKTGVDWLVEKPVDLLKQVFDSGYLDVAYRDNRGNTLLHKVCQVNLNYEERKAKALYQKVKFLLKQGVDPGIENIEDKKAVDCAMDDNLKAKAVELLLKSNT